MSLRQTDPDIHAAIQHEVRRQETGLELIASENFVSRAVLEAAGSVMTNKYAEGYPGKRYYGGCEFVDVAEQLAIDRAKALFGCEHVNVQPHSGTQANMAVYFGFLRPGDKLMGMDLSSGGHLTHGHRLSYSGRDFEVIAYGVDRKKIDACFFGKLAILNGAIQHSGDNLTGEGGGDDETITVHLGGLPPEVTGLVFTVNSFSGQKFTEVAKAYCRLVDAASGQELVRFDLSNAEPRTGVLMCKLVRQFSGEWDMTALGEYVDSRTVRGMVKPGGAAL